MQLKVPYLLNTFALNATSQTPWSKSSIATIILFFLIDKENIVKNKTSKIYHN
jgi:hypothetical protein